MSCHISALGPPRTPERHRRLQLKQPRGLRPAQKRLAAREQGKQRDSAGQR